jgi:hypothetical protein
MRATTWILGTTLAIAFFGCSDNADDDGGPESASGAGAAGPASGGGAAGPATGAGASGGSGASGGAGPSVTIEMESFTIPSGGEVYKCQNFANPFGDVAEVSKFESHMTAGSHHLLLFYNEGAADGPLEDCSGLEFAATPYSTQLPDDQVAFPAGVAARIDPGTGIRLQSHYLNTSPDPITAHVEVTFHLAAPGTVTAHAGVLFIIEPNFTILPNQTDTVTHDCSVPFDMNLIKAASHMHKHGTHFEATIAGETVFETTEWAEPEPAYFDPPRAVSGGDPLHFGCTFVNNSSKPLTFGESADTDEMCIFGAAFYPLPEGSGVTVSCD